MKDGKKGRENRGGKVDRRDGVEGWAKHGHEVQMGKRGRKDEGGEGRSLGWCRGVSKAWT